MGLMDKVKAQATQLAQKTQDTAREGKAKLDQAQANRRADVLLRNLGALIYAERTGRAAADSQQQVDKLVADISAHEAENGINLAGEATPAGPQSGTESAAEPAPEHGTAAPADGDPSTSFPPPADDPQP